ncbi:hypothetical protein SDC9_139710 [bioreactor metagenome]|jgi:hypothetical protein|uniref:DUF4194 domain-containing protein n=1 Tax=bioreactor metagenome TaxID=1076179 RepID=A0A645DTH0_9ZZZZ
MPNTWDEVIRQGDVYESSDFKSAAYQLVSNQIIYESNQSQATAYRLIDRYRDAFRDAFDLLGMSLKFDTTYRYIAAIPYVEKQKYLSTDDSLLLLVLRKGYHEQAIQGNLEAGSAVLSIEELQELYRVETSRELPNEVRALKDLLNRMKAFGVVKMPQTEPGSDQPFDVAILPGIAALVSEATLSRLTDYVSSARVANTQQGDA